jgi:hypothetical protein
LVHLELRADSKLKYKSTIRKMVGVERALALPKNNIQLDPKPDQDVKGLRENLLRILTDPELAVAACYTGITRMLRTSNFPVLPRVLIEDGISPSDWFKETFESSRGLSAQLIERCFKIDLRGAIARLKAKKLPCEEYGTATGRILNVLNWSDLMPILTSDPSLLRNLGLLWYVDGLCEEESDFLEMVGDLVIDLSKLDEQIQELAFKLEEEVLIQVGRNKQPKVKWSDVVRIPL